MYITTKLDDPIADLKLVDAFFRWALMSIAEVAGEPGLDLVLRSAGMERFRQVYASNKLEAVSGLTFRDYANVNAGALQVLGAANTGNVYHSGRVSARHAMRRNGEIFNPPPQLVSGQMEQGDQLKASLETILDGYLSVAQHAGQHYHAWLTETDTHFYYHMESCALCAGISAPDPICMFFSGSLMESLKWYTGIRYNIHEVECRAMGAPACVWEIEKQPVESGLIRI